jgi:tetratricopeptide (TPR) repeat protein
MTDSCSDANEELALNSALEESTPILAESLQRAEQARRRKRRLIAGGLIMLLLGASIVASLVLTAVEPGAPGESGETKAVVQTEEPQVSIDQFEEAVESEALGQQGWQLWSERKYAEAAQKFVAAIKVDPESPNLWNGLGWSLFHSGKRDKAVDAFNQCLKLDENWQAATNGLGQIAYANRDYAQAKVWFLKSPNASAAQHTLVSVYLLTGEHEKASELSATLLEALPEESEDPSVLAQRVWLAELNAAAVSGQLPDALRQRIEPVLPAKPEPLVSEKAEEPGGINLLDNGGFERGTQGWIIGSNSGRMTLTPDTQEMAEGKQSLRITKTGGMPIDIVRINAKKLTSGQSVDVSAMIKAEDAVNAWMKFYVWDADGNVLIEDLDVTRIHGTHDWRKAGRRFKLPDNADSAAIQFWLVMGGTVWLDDVKVTPVE